MSEIIRYVIGLLLLLFGMASLSISLIGVFKFRFVMNRMQSAAIIDTLGLLLVLSGLFVMKGTWDYLPKLILIVIFQWIGSPIASHMVGRTEINDEEHLEDYMEFDEIEGEAEA